MVRGHLARSPWQPLVSRWRHKDRYCQHIGHIGDEDVREGKQGRISQRKVLRALYRAQERARTPEGLPTFLELFERDARGRHVVVDARGHTGRVAADAVA